MNNRTDKKDIEQKNRARRKKKFLKVLAENNGFVSRSLKKIKIDRGTVYKWRNNDSEFAEKWAEIVERAGEEVEAEFYDNQLTGDKQNAWAQTVFLKYRRGWNDAEKEANRPNINITITGKDMD